MEIIVPLGLALLGMTAAVYAQIQIPRHTVLRKGALLSRIMLIGAGLAFAYVMTSGSDSGDAAIILEFLAWFGFAHVPAAFILMFRESGGAEKR